MLYPVLDICVDAERYYQTEFLVKSSLRATIPGPHDTFSDTTTLK